MQPTETAPQPGATPQPTQTTASPASPFAAPTQVPTVQQEPPPRVASTFSLELLKVVDPEKQSVMLKALIDVEVARQTFDLDQRHARSFAESGEFSDIKGQTLLESIAKAMTKIQMGRAWGMNHADAMRNIYFTNGRPAIENNIVASALKQSGYSWIPEWTFEDTKDAAGKPWKRCTGCTLYLQRYNANEKAFLPLVGHDGKQVSVEFTANDADHALIWEKGKQIPLSTKWNFASFGRDMYYWRCISRVHKYYAPEVLRGGRTFEERLDVEADNSELVVVPTITAAPDAPNPLRDMVLADDAADAKG